MADLIASAGADSAPCSNCGQRPLGVLAVEICLNGLSSCYKVLLSRIAFRLSFIHIQIYFSYYLNFLESQAAYNLTLLALLYSYRSTTTYLALLPSPRINYHIEFQFGIELIIMPVGPRVSKEEFMHALGLNPHDTHHEQYYRAMRVSQPTKPYLIYRPTNLTNPG
jgi:hypothetical protein